MMRIDYSDVDKQIYADCLKITIDALHCSLDTHKLLKAMAEDDLLFNPYPDDKVIVANLQRSLNAEQRSIDSTLAMIARIEDKIKELQNE